MASGTFLPPGLSRSIVKIESGGTDNYVMTAVDGETIQGESKLTFDGSTLTLDGDLTFTGAQTISTSSGALTIDSAASHLYLDAVSGGDIRLNASGTDVDIVAEWNGNNTAWYVEGTSGTTKFTKDIDMTSAGTLLNVGASGNNWTATQLLHSGLNSSSEFERTGSVLNSGRTALILKHTTDGDMVDGFGVFLDFVLEDTGVTDRNMGFIGIERAGADNLGMFTLTLNNAGSYDEVLRIDNVANVQINGSAEHGTTKGANILSLFNGTPPAGTLTNGASFFCATGEMKVIDAAGNITVLSPHDDDGKWVFHSQDDSGKVIHIQMERMMKRLDEMLGGGFIEEYIED
jgi:hypothetical protein